MRPCHGKTPLHRTGAIGIAALAILALLFTGLPADYAAQAQATATIRCEPEYIAGPPASNLSLDIYLEDVVDLYGIDFHATFDPLVAQVVDASPDPGINIETLTTFFDPNFPFINTVDNATGDIDYASSELVPDPPVSGSGPIARVTFSNVTPGTFILHFTEATVSNDEGTETNPIREDCTIAFCPATNVVYVDDDYTVASADGHTWGCDAFDNIQDAIDAVTAPGLAHVYAGSYAPFTAGKDVVLSGEGLPVIDAGGADAAAITAGTVVMKGFVIENADVALDLTGGTLTAYANNINTYTTAVSIAGATFNGRHNWWGVHDVQPAGVDNAAWEARLGADIEAWAEGAAGATLGAAVLSGGAGGTGVIVSHGRDFPGDAPFGNGVLPHAAQMCSDYYDFFTVNGSGASWSVSVPVDNNTNCNTETLAEKRLFWIPDNTECYPADNSACWDLIAPGVITISGQNLVASGMSVADLGGTPFVAGDAGGSDPTALTLTAFTVAAGAAPWLLWLAAGLALALVGLIIFQIHLGRKTT